MDKELKITIATVLGGAILAGGAVVAEMQPEPVTLENPEKVVWQKPTTDEAWAEDVKKESFDIKSTKVLHEMVDAHTEKLAIQQAELDTYAEMEKNGQDPVKFIAWTLRQQLEGSPNRTEEQLTEITMEYATTQYAERKYEVEKLKQSIERMNKEIELREKGFVVVEGEEKKGIFGGNSSVPPERIRHIHD